MFLLLLLLLFYTIALDPSYMLINESRISGWGREWYDLANERVTLISKLTTRSNWPKQNSWHNKIWTMESKFVWVGKLVAAGNNVMWSWRASRNQVLSAVSCWTLFLQGYPDHWVPCLHICCAVCCLETGRPTEVAEKDLSCHQVRIGGTWSCGDCWRRLKPCASSQCRDSWRIRESCTSYWCWYTRATSEWWTMNHISCQ